MRTWRLVVVAIACSIAVSAPAAFAATEIKIATWNIAWLNADDDAGMIRRLADDYHRLAKYAARINADIIALQEVQGDAAARRVFSPAKYDFEFEDTGNVQRVGFAIRKGIAHVRNPDVTSLNVTGGLRSGVDITVDLGQSKLRLLAVHLKCCCPGDPLSTSNEHCPTLRKQLPELEDWIDRRAAESVPFIVLGDFNRRLTSSDAFWREIDDGSPPNADLQSVVLNQSGKCWADEGVRRFIDHIVLDRRAWPWAVPAATRQERYEAADRPHAARLSDHCPLRATLRIP